MRLLQLMNRILAHCSTPRFGSKLNQRSSLTFPKLPIQASVLDRFADVIGPDVRGGSKISNRACHIQNSIIRSRGESEFCNCHHQQFFSGVVEFAMGKNVFRDHVGVAEHSFSPFKSFHLNFTSKNNSLPNRRRTFSRLFTCEFFVLHCRYFDLKINPVE